MLPWVCQILVAVVMTYLNRFWEIMVTPGDAFDAFDLTRMANDFCMIILNLLVIAVWTTLCFQTKAMRHLWSWKSWMFGGDTMMGLGFVPRPAAASVGFLLFVTGIFVSERVVGAHDLQAHGIAQGEWCRADVKEPADYMASNNWDSRLHRQLPIGCYFGMVHDARTRFPWTSTENMTFAQDAQNFVPGMFNVTRNETGVEPRNLKHPTKSSHSEWNPIVAFVWSLLPQFIRGGQELGFVPSGVNHEYEVDDQYLCMYQCVKWKKGWGFQDFLSKLGVVVAGGAVVTKLTGSVTEVCGYSRVTEDTDEKELGRILSLMTPLPQSFWHKWCYKSCAFTALVLGFIRLCTVGIYKIDDYGLYTVDYYVSMTILFSVITSTVLRSFNPYTITRIAYTKNMWSKGVDRFMLWDQDDIKHNKPRDIDLFMWLHLSYTMRAYLLINHARKVTQRAVNHDVECILPFTCEAFIPRAGGGHELTEISVKHGDVGKVVAIEGDKAVVEWERLKREAVAKLNPGLKNKWECKKWLVPAEFDHLADFSADWQKLVLERIGRDEDVEEVRRNVIALFKENSDVASSESMWQIMLKNFWTCWEKVPLPSPLRRARIDEAQARRIRESLLHDQSGSRLARVSAQAARVA